MRDNVPGCALIVLLMAVVSGALAVFNLVQEGGELQRLGRMRTVLAVITDKGVATYEHRDQRRGRLGETTSERQYWIRFECQVGGAICKGNRLSLFPAHEDILWARYEKGGQYEAHYDPDLDECILSIDQPSGGVRTHYLKMVLGCVVVAMLALIVYRRTNRRSGAGQGTPAGTGS